MATINFDIDSVEPSVNTYELLPRGRYMVMIIGSQVKDTKAGDGQFIEWTFEVMDGPFKGRRLWERMNIINKNKKTEDIARSNLSALGKACGKRGMVAETDELHNIPLFVDVQIKPEDKGYAASNEIKGYSSSQTTGVAGQVNTAPAQTAQVTPMPQGERKAPVWKRG
jgi:hypothetical protein